MTNVYKIELCVIDHDDIGAESIKEVLQETKYPNWCISPSVVTIEGKDIGEWDDNNALNYRNTQKQELRRLFSPWLPITTAPHDGTRILFFYGARKAVFTAWYEKEFQYAIGSIEVYAYWHLESTNKMDLSLYFEEENPPNCYWQPLPELPA